MAGHPVEDIFDETADLRHLEQRDWRKTERNLVTDGYREGRSAGEEASLQENFDKGYASGLKRVWDVSYVRGRLCAAIALRHLCAGEVSAEWERAGDLVAKLTRLEEQLAAKRGHETTDDLEIADTLRRGLAALSELAPTAAVAKRTSEPTASKEPTD